MGKDKDKRIMITGQRQQYKNKRTTTSESRQQGNEKRTTGKTMRQREPGTGTKTT